MINLFSFGDTNVKQVQNCDLQINPFVFLLASIIKL